MRCIFQLQIVRTIIYKNQFYIPRRAIFGGLSIGFFHLFWIINNHLIE